MEGFQAMGQWTRDHVPFPGQAFRETVQLMRDEALVNDTVRLDGRRISLRALTWLLLNVVAAKDHIVPCAAARPVTELVGSQHKEVLELGAGHVGLVMRRAAATTTMPRLIGWLLEHDEEEQ